MRLSAVVIAQDEEENLPGCLSALSFCDEIVVVDGGSRDRTVELARAGGARVLVRPFDDFTSQHQFGLAQVQGDWVLSVDADERPSPELQAEIRATLDAAPRAVAFSIPFRNHFRGEWLRHGGLWPDRHLRLYRRDRARYLPGRAVHERLEISGEVGQLRAPMLHFTYRSLSHCLAKMARYGEAAAQDRFARGERASALGVVLRPLWRFVRAYLLQLGVLDGGRGAVVAAARAYEAYVRTARLWELERFGPPRG